MEGAGSSRSSRTTRRRRANPSPQQRLQDLARRFNNEGNGRPNFQGVLVEQGLTNEQLREQYYNWKNDDTIDAAFGTGAGSRDFLTSESRTIHRFGKVLWVDHQGREYRPEGSAQGKYLYCIPVKLTRSLRDKGFDKQVGHPVPGESLVLTPTEENVDKRVLGVKVLANVSDFGRSAGVIECV